MQRSCGAANSTRLADLGVTDIQFDLLASTNWLDRGDASRRNGRRQSHDDPKGPRHADPTSQALAYDGYSLC